MIINAEAEVYYTSGVSIIAGWEGLRICIKFKEQGQFFKTKIDEYLISRRRYERRSDFEEEHRFYSVDEFYDAMENTLQDEEGIKEYAIQLIKDYFKEKEENNSEEYRKDKISNLAKQSKKIQIEVKIK